MNSDYVQMKWFENRKDYRCDWLFGEERTPILVALNQNWSRDNDKIRDLWELDLESETESKECGGVCDCFRVSIFYFFVFQVFCQPEKERNEVSRLSRP